MSQGRSLKFLTSDWEHAVATALCVLLVCVVALTVSHESVAFAAGGNSYTTKFPVAENPISDGGRWINGKSAGLKWQNVRTTPGLAIGTQTGRAGQYDDSTAVLSGTWGLNQTVQATAYVTDPNCGVGSQEVELRLRSTVLANSNTGYEVNFSTCKGIASDSYMQIVRWNGPLGDYTVLSEHRGRNYGVQNGDLVKATISGTTVATINVYVNGQQMGQATDPKAFTSGNPGIGFWLKEAFDPTTYGFSNFSATDGSGNEPEPPTNLSVIVR